MRKVLSLFFFLTACAHAAPGTTHTISSSGFTFSPDSIAIAPGDSVRFVLALLHNAAQVTKETWNANDTAWNGGFWVPFGGGTIAISDTGIHYYVCQNHAPMGMKGIILVRAPAGPPNSISVECVADRDGNTSTSVDRNLKDWGLKLYKDSVGSGVVIDSVGSGSSLTADNLPAGTYVAAEADSNSWSHISVSVDGASQGATSAHQWPITVTSGENRVIDFINYARHTIMNSGFTFVPNSIAIPAGDTVHFVLETMHTAREVSQATWLADDTTSNGGFDLPFGGGSAALSVLGTHYYVCLPHASIGMKGRIVVASPESFFTVHRSVSAGWNIVSLPVDAADHLVTTLFPGAVSRAFAYEGSYTAQTILSAGAGYWLKFDNGQTAPLIGFPVVRDTITALKGWNLIGSLAIRRPSKSITSVPSGIVSSPLFGFNGSYSVADTIEPGFGYWVRLSQEGKLILDTAAGSPAPASLIDERLLRDASRLVIRDAADHEKTLYVLETGAGITSPPSFTELPPVPPPGAFDIRFASGQSMKLIGTNESGSFPILLSSVSYPITVRWEIPSMNRAISLGMDGRTIGLRGAGAIRISIPLSSLSLDILKAGTVPAAFALSEAFPNPFNPSTIIEYSLPVESRVHVRVHNVLGQLVATLADAIEGAGEKSVTWNASGHVSGVYFIRLDAAATGGSGGSVKSFTRAVKVVLQK